MWILLKSKLMRTIKSTLKQFITLSTIVLVGTALFISANTSYYNIDKSYNLYKAEIGIPDHVFKVVSAPLSLTEDIKAISGIQEVNGRTQKDVQVADSYLDENTTARFVSFTLPMNHELYGLYLKEGEISSANKNINETNVVLEASFAKENQLKIGDKLTVKVNDKNITLNIISLAYSPEFMFPSRNSISEFETSKNFAIIFIEKEELDKLFNNQADVNEFIIKYKDGVNEKEINDEIGKLLEPYGVLGNYDVSNIASEKGIRAQLHGLKQASKFLPTIFLLIEIAFIYAFLRVLINSHRIQIGIMKALGFDNKIIILFYTLYCVILTTVGSFLGAFVGIGLKILITEKYSIFLNLPLFSKEISPKSIILAILLSLATGIISGLLASKQIVNISPAESMKPKPPKVGGYIFFEKHSLVWKNLSDSWKISLRSMARNKIRFITTALGIGSAVFLINSSMIFNDSRDNLLEHYFQKENTYTSILRLNSFSNIKDIEELIKLPEVKQIDPMLEAIATFKTLGDNPIEKEGLLIGMDESAVLKNVFDQEFNKLTIPHEGILLNSSIASKLGIKIGDNISLEIKDYNGVKFEKQIKVIGINSQFVGLSSYTSISEINNLMKTGNVVNGAFIKLSDENNIDFYKSVKSLKNFDSLVYSKDQKIEAMKTLSNLTFFVIIISGAAFILGLAIIYNSSISNFSGRQKEMATFKMMGFSNLSISNILLNELIIEALIGICIGVPAGRLIGSQFINLIESEGFKYPNVAYVSTSLTAIAIAIIFVLIGHLLAIYKLFKFNFIEALK